MKIFTRLVPVALLLLGNFFTAVAEDPQAVPVFSQGYQGVQYYRIPAVAQISDGTIVAIADNRHDNNNDLGTATISVVCRRSTDGGATWGDMITIAEGTSVSTSYGDAAVAYDAASNTLVTVYSGKMGFWAGTHTNHAGFYMSKSTDGGLTWSAPYQFDSQLYNKTAAANWKGAFCASGAMLITKHANNHPGRLMFVANVNISTTNNEEACREWVCYSDDLGTTWNIANTSAPNYSKGNESKIVELPDGTLIMSIRNNSGKRAFSKSTNGGATWSDGYQVNDLIEPSCNGDIFLYPSVDGQTRLIHGLCNNASARRNGTLFVSYDNGATWGTKRAFNPGLTGYIALTPLNDGKIGILFEDGTDCGLFGSSQTYNIKYMSVDLDWVTSGADNGQATGAVPAGITPDVLDCNGIDRYMRIPASSDFNVAAGAGHAIVIRVKPAALPGNATVNSAYTGTGTAAFYTSRTQNSARNQMYGGVEIDAMYVNNNYYMAAEVLKNGTSWSAANLEPYQTTQHYIGIGEWSTIIYTNDGSNHKLYVNGVERKTSAWSGSMVCNDDILLGARYLNQIAANGVSDYYQGLIDDVAIYNRALTTDEIAAITAAAATNEAGATGTEGYTFPTNGLLAAYNFSDIVGTTVPDISGNGHNATLVNFPQYVAQTGSAITIPTIDAAKGTIHVYKDGAEITNGRSVADGTELTVEVTPTLFWSVAAIKINGVALPEGTNTFVVDGATTISVDFEPSGLALPTYCQGTPYEQQYHYSLYGTILVNDVEAFSYEMPTTGVIDFTAQHVVTIHPGDVIKFRMSGGNPHSKWSEMGVYCDWNADGTWNTTADEQYILVNNPLVVLNNNEYTITVPETVANGLIGIRINSGEATQHSTGATLTPCTSLHRGSLVTFTAWVKGAAASLHVNAPEGVFYTVTDAAGNKVANGTETAEGDEFDMTILLNEGFSMSGVTVNGAEVAVTDNGNGTYSAHIVATEAGASVSIEAVGPTQPTYNHVTGNISSPYDRAVETVTVKDGDGNTLGTVAGSTGNAHAIYVDRTSTAAFNVHAGQTLDIQCTAGTGEWMQTCIYIDYNRDGVFTPSVDKTNHVLNPGSELVTSNGIDMTGTEQFWNSIGQGGGFNGNATYKTYNSNNSNALIPTFTLPDDLALGAYRVRYKVDWAHEDDPDGTASRSNNTMAANRAAMIDFTILVARNITIASADEDMGSVEFANYVGTTVADNANSVLVIATPAAGYEFVNWTDQNGDIVSIDAVYVDKSNKNVTLTANFAAASNPTLELSVNGEGTVDIWSAMDNNEHSGDRIQDGDEVTLNRIYVFFRPGAEQELESVIVNSEEIDLDTIEELASDTHGATLLCLVLDVDKTQENLVISVTFTSNTSGIEGVGEDVTNAPAEYYNIQGVRVAADSLIPGVYVVKTGNKVAKVLVK